MIRINLAAADRPTKKAGRGGAPSSSTPSAPGAVQLYLFLALFVGGAAVVCAGLYFLIMRDIADLDNRISAAKKREAELQAIKKKVEEFQAKKKMFQDKVALIERLRLEQSGPVHMLDELSKALPDFLWLTSIAEGGGTLKIKGQTPTTGMPAESEFISNLQRSGWFPMAEHLTYRETPPVVDFEISATFRDPTLAAKLAEQQAQAAAAAPPAGAKPPGAK
jgi:type IV pilus assembly protein PilN